jgi:hypothetical protein
MPLPAKVKKNFLYILCFEVYQYEFGWDGDRRRSAGQWKVCGPPEAHRFVALSLPFHPTG